MQISDYRKRRPAQVAACFTEIFSLYEQGKVRPAAATVFPLARAGEALTAAVKIIDKAAQKGVIDRKTASRKISRLTLAVRRASA